MAAILVLFGSFGLSTKEPYTIMNCPIVHRHPWHQCWHHCLCKPPPGTGLGIETSYLVYICTYVPPYMCDARTMYRQAGRLTDASRPSFCASEHLTDKVGNPVEAGLTVWKDSTLPGCSKVFRVHIDTCLRYYF